MFDLTYVYIAVQEVIRDVPVETLIDKVRITHTYARACTCARSNLLTLTHPLQVVYRDVPVEKIVEKLVEKVLVKIVRASERASKR